MGSLVISDVVTDITRFPHTMLGGHVAQQSPAESPYRTTAPPHSSQSSNSASIEPLTAPTNPIVPPSSTSAPRPPATSAPINAPRQPSSSSRQPSLATTETNLQSFNNNATPIRQSFASQQNIPQPALDVSSYAPPAPPSNTPANPHSNVTQGTASYPTPPTPLGRMPLDQNCIKVRDLSHIQSFASEEFLSSPPRSRPESSSDVGFKYEISAMPVTDIIEMVAGLLTKITTTNDRQHEHLHRHIPPPEGTTGLSQQTTSVLAFHGKNVPSITIQSYLSRVHKYCPTTYEVFLSLLVYFDRMTERVNSGPMQSLRHASQQPGEHMGQSMGGDTVNSPSSESTRVGSSPSIDRLASSRPPSGSSETHHHPAEASSPFIVPDPSDGEELDLSHFFVVDSFNIHRLVIAGVTCASKFFSDVFYTNSRYAKVGGLPLAELNHLELQFLLLNDFRLSVPVEELEAYGTMLVEFYAREVMASRQGGQAMDGLYSPVVGAQTTVS
ncbi:MAG: hypothetical protein M1836_004598 [Candelina mexicana]|nr:MAG: hypothetical protein M1836_004598 [Candelina mexicana]